MDAHSRLPALVAFVAPLVVFLPALENQFLLWDDRALLLDNPSFRGLGAEQLEWMFTTLHMGPYQPLAWLTYGLDYTLWGMNPWGFHLTNVLLHALASGLLAACLLRWLPRLVPALEDAPAVTGWAALLGALFWSCHPLRVESVAWAAQRRDVLSGVFLFASLRAWAGHLDTSPDGVGWARSRNYWTSIGLLGCALLAKATAMGWCVVLLLLDRAVRRPGSTRTLLVEKLPAALVAAPVAVVAWLGQAGSGAVRDVAEVGLLDRVVLAGHAAAFYPFRTVVPLDLRAHYARGFPFDPWQPQLVAGTIAAAGCCLAALVLRRRSKGWAGAWCAYLLLLAPVSGLTAIGSHLVADRFSYVTTVPLVLAVVASAAAWVAARPATRARGTILAAALAVAASAAGAFALTGTWKTTATLFERVLAFEPRSWRAHMVAGLAAVREERLTDARSHFATVLELHPAATGAAKAQLAWVAYRDGDPEQALRLAEEALAEAPADFTALRTAALVADDAGRLDDAEAYLRRAVEVRPRHSRALSHLAWVRFRRDADAEARELVYRALEIDPQHAGGWRLFGMILEKAGDDDGAEKAYRRALELEPDAVEPLGNLAMLAGRRGDVAEAERLLARVLALDPSNSRSRVVLGGLFESRGRREEALALYLDGIRLNADEALLRGNAARMLLALERGDEALPHSLRAVELLPDRPGPRLQLADLYMRLGRTEDARREATLVLDRARAASDRGTENRARALLDRLAD